MKDYEELALHQMRMRERKIKMEKRARERAIGKVIGVLMLFMALLGAATLDSENWLLPVVMMVLGGSYVLVMAYARGAFEQ